jgi:hypothetical protein
VFSALASGTKIPSRSSRGPRTIQVGQSWRTRQRRRRARPACGQEPPPPASSAEKSRRHVGTRPPRIAGLFAESHSPSPITIHHRDSNSSILFPFHLSRYLLGIARVYSSRPRRAALASSGTGTVFPRHHRGIVWVSGQLRPPCYRPRRNRSGWVPSAVP